MLTSDDFRRLPTSCHRYTFTIAQASLTFAIVPIKFVNRRGFFMSRIDITTEQLILFSQLPNHLPKQPSGKKIHLSACYRWKNQGLCGIRLVTVFVSGNRYTSKEATNRFWHAVTAAKDGRMAESTKRAKHNRLSADTELAAAGW